MNDLIDDPYWTLDQVVAWARSRSLEAVKFARSNGGVALEIKINVEAQKAMQQGRDIEAELWKAIGREKPEDAPLSSFGEPPISVTLQDKSSEQTGVTLTHVARDGFPINAYVQSLLQSGKIVAFGLVEGKPLSGEIKKEEWAGLQIVEEKNGRRVVADDLRREVIRNARIHRDQVVAAFDNHETSHGPARKLTKPKALAEILRNRWPTRPELKINEIDKIIRDDAQTIGQYSERTLKTAISIAWPHDRVQNGAN